MTCGLWGCGRSADDESKTVRFRYLCCSECGWVEKEVVICDYHFMMVKDSVKKGSVSLSDGS